MVALRNRADHYIFALWFLLPSSFFFFFSSANLRSRRLDVCHTSTHGVSLVRISDAGLKCAARGSLEMQDAKKVAKNRHLSTIAQLWRAMSSQLRHVSTIGKKLVTQQYVLQTSSQYGELRPTSGWDRSIVWGTPANFNGFRVLAALLHGSQVVGVSQTLRRWTEGTTYVRQGDHHVGQWPTF